MSRDEARGDKLKPRIAIVAAMARELRPLVRGWKREITAEGVTIYTSDRAIASVCGAWRATGWLATTAALRLGPIRRIISAGWAGGLHEGIVPGGVWRVREVVNSATGEVLETTPADGIKTVGAVLVTAEHGYLGRRQTADAEDVLRRPGGYGSIGGRGGRAEEQDSIFGDQGGF